MKYNKTGVTLYYIDENEEEQEESFKNEEEAYDYVLSLKELEDFKKENISATVFYQERGCINSASEEPLDEHEEDLDYETLKDRAGYEPTLTVKKKKRNRLSF